MVHVLYALVSIAFCFDCTEFCFSRATAVALEPLAATSYRLTVRCLARLCRPPSFHERPPACVPAAAGIRQGGSGKRLAGRPERR